ncbi:class I lanthipeptide [Kordia sp.]|uniref:class I lanthipeptide n=1 Tax=Kordia sp. TaxID=1965332 RepID=UPI003D6AEEE9
MKKKKLENKLGLKKEAIAKLKGGATSQAGGRAEKCSDSIIYYCTWEIDCPTLFGSCDYYCTIA